MKQLERILWLVVSAELLFGALWMIPRLTRPVPHLPNLDSLDPITAQDLRELRNRARDGDARDWRTLAEALLGSGFYSYAEQCFHRAAELDPNDVRSVYGRGFCLERVGRTHESTTVLKEAITQADYDLSQTCWYEIGRNALREEDPRRAEAAFRRLESFGPAQYQLAKLLIRTGRAEEAISILDHELVNAPNSLKFLQLRGWAARDIGRIHEATRFADRAERAEYQLSLEYNSTFIGMFASQHGFGKMLADCLKLRQTGSLDQQSHAFGKVLDVIRNDELWQYESLFIDAGEVELQRNRPQEALRLLDERERRSYQSAASLRLRGDALDKLGRDREARNAWERSVALNPDTFVYRSLAALARRRGDAPAASENAARAGYLEGTAAFRNNELDRAFQELKLAAALDPKSPQTWFYLGETDRALGRNADARAELQRCVEIDPDFSRAVEALVKLRGIKSSS